MIDPGTIQELLGRAPFEPFRIRMADGKAYDVVDSRAAVTMESILFLALGKRDRFKMLSCQNMTSLENIVTAKS